MTQRVRLVAGLEQEAVPPGHVEQRPARGDLTVLGADGRVAVDYLPRGLAGGLRRARDRVVAGCSCAACGRTYAASLDG